MANQRECLTWFLRAFYYDYNSCIPFPVINTILDSPVLQKLLIFEVWTVKLEVFSATDSGNKQL